jgi:hypothetical protein
VEKKSRYGKLFYACAGYPACQYATWDLPLNEPCPSCQWPILTLKTSKRRGVEKVCPQHECNYGWVIEAPEGKSADELNAQGRPPRRAPKTVAAPVVKPKVTAKKSVKKESTAVTTKPKKASKPAIGEKAPKTPVKKINARTKKTDVSDV